VMTCESHIFRFARIMHFVLLFVCPTSAGVQLYSPHQSISHPVLNKRPHLYFLRLHLITAQRNVTGPLALSTTTSRN
jgi:hypothetical protein